VNVNVNAYVPCVANVCDVIETRSNRFAPVEPEQTPAYVIVVDAGTSNVTVPVITPPDADPHVIAFRAYAGEPPVTSPVTEPVVPGSAVNRAAYAASVPYFVAREFFSVLVAIAIRGS
jgi:hypothetical protein